jgi:HAD superfamily hydrolase (TIGR01484 family)
MDLPIKLISTDFDGTLFAEFESPPIPTELEQLIGDLQARGVKWAINTGRDMSSLMETLGRSGISIEPDYLVLVEREIHRHKDSLYVALEPWNSACTRLHGDLFARLETELPEIVRWISSRFHARIYEDSYSPLCLIAANNNDMDAIYLHLEGCCRKVPHLSVMRNDVYARLCHKDYNKGTALGHLTSLLGLDSSQIFAIGDHLNDLPMLSLEYARFLAAPANSVPQVQAVVRRQGGIVTSATHGQGVFEAIKYYLEPRAA